MKKTTSTLLSILVFSISLLISACKKSGDEPEGSFTWTYRDTPYTATIHTAFRGSMAPTPVIIASKGTSLRSFNVSISVTSFNTGIYTINGSNANSLLYIDNAGNTLFTTSGSVNITASSTNSISGTFSATVNDLSGVPRPVSGSFTNTAVEY